MKDKKGLLALTLNGILLGTYGTFTILLQNTLTGLQQVALRSIIAFLLAVPLIFILKSKLHFEKKYNKHLLLYLTSFALSSILFTTSVIKSSIALGVFGLYIGSILCAFIIGFIFFKEKLTTAKIVSVILVVIAIFLINSPTTKAIFSIGLFVGILGGVFDAIGNGFKKYFGGKIERPTLISFQIFSTLIISLFFSIIWHEIIKLPHLFSFGFLGILLYAVTYLTVAYLSMYGFQHFDLNLGTIVISSELFWAVLFAFILFHQIPSIYQIIGGILIGLAIITPYLKFAKIKYFIKN